MKRKKRASSGHDSQLAWPVGSGLSGGRGQKTRAESRRSMAKLSSSYKVEQCDMLRSKGYYGKSWRDTHTHTHMSSGCDLCNVARVLRGIDNTKRKREGRGNRVNVV